MILNGNQRGGARDLALHLMKAENEHAELHELRGFVSDDLLPALNEAYAASKGTRAKQFLFSMSLNPPPGANVSTAGFEAAIERVERKLGLTGQPRAIVFHEKEGPGGYRRHAHAVWSRINAREMKAIPLAHSKRKMMDVSRELFIEHGWKMPRGMLPGRPRDPKNFTLAEWQQAKRAGKDPRAIKQIFRLAFQDSWAASDSKAGFESALRERGYRLARGDKRGFVALDQHAEVYSIPKWAGLKTKEVRARLGPESELPSVAETRAAIARDMAGRLTKLYNHQQAAIKARKAELRQKLRDMAAIHRQQRQSLQEAQTLRQGRETKDRQARFRRGLLGLWDHVSGRHRRIKKRNEHETQAAKLRDAREKDQLIFRQTGRRHALKRRIERLHGFAQAQGSTIKADIKQYRDISAQKRDLFNLRAARSQSHTRGPKMER